MNKLVFIIIWLPCIMLGQKWQEYSDSISFNFKQNNIDKTLYYIELADKDLAKFNISKDTTYAEYMYRKAVVRSTLGNYDTSLLKESLEIWEKSSKKNYTKIMKLYYFLGVNYFSIADKSQNKIDYDISYNYFEKCYFLIKKYNLYDNSNYSGVLFYLLFIDTLTNKSSNKFKKYLNKYIKYVKVNDKVNFNFEYIYVLGLKEDYLEVEKILLYFLNKYESEKLNNDELLFQIYFQLFINKLKFKNKIGDFNFPNEIIKYGEKALKIGNLNKSRYQLEIDTIHLQLELAYSAIKDNINSDKYRKLNYDYYKSENELDYWDELDKLYNENDYVNFKIKFDEYEIKFKQKNQISDLLEIYKYSLTLFERSILFSLDDIEKQIEFISKNRASLDEDDLLLFEYLLVEFYVFTDQINKALEIIVKNELINDLEWQLMFNNAKAVCESALGLKDKALKTAFNSIDKASNIYGDEDPRVLQYLLVLLDLDLMGRDINSIKIETQILKILYGNNLENTLLGVGVWNSLGEKALSRCNYQDALIYFQKSISIINETKNISNPTLLLHSLYGITNTYIFLNDLIKAKEYLDLTKKYLDENQSLKGVFLEGYYYTLGNYFFWHENFIEAKTNYEKSFSFYNHNKISAKKIRYYMCSYLLENNTEEFIKNIQQYQEENNDTFWGLNLLYLVNYNLGNLEGARVILENQLNILIESNKYFHLLSEGEKLNLYKIFINQFEFLNSHLINSDFKFLENYINYRFYIKSLLFSNSINSNLDNHKNKELYTELKNNTIQINRALENKSQNIKDVEELKNKNREIEKFLLANSKSLMTPTLKELKSKLKQNEAYVEIIRINKQSQNPTNKASDLVKTFTDSIFYGAILIKKNTTPKFILIDSTNQLENNFITNFKYNIQNKHNDTLSYKLFFQKIDDELNGISKIYLVTDGIYNSINVESIYNPKRKQYLIDYLKIQQIQSVRTITDYKNQFKFNTSTKVVLFGNPEFDLLITESTTNDFSTIRGTESVILNEIKSNFKIGRLHETQKEMEAIEKILKDSKSSIIIYSNACATEDNLKKIDSPDILHIASHGYFLANDDTSKIKHSIANLINENYRDTSYLKSGLLLAGAQNTINGQQSVSNNNGILTAEEAKSLNLKYTELVVLSACETGLGDHLVGQGVIGLQRAFMIAGAKSVIMSLWSVSDEKTKELMILFYSNWFKKSMSKEEALYQAKIEMKKLYPEPYYWAGFVLLE